MSKKTELPVSVVCDGRTWNLYAFEFDTPDGTFSSYLYAISDEHAAELLVDMKETARISGQIIEAHNG